MFDERHEDDGEGDEDGAVDEEPFVFEGVHDHTGEHGGDSLGGHGGDVVVAGVLSDGGVGGELDDHGQGVDVDDDEPEAGDEVEQREERGGHEGVGVRLDEGEDEQEADDRHRETDHDGLSSAELCRHVAHGDEGYRADAHGDAGDDGRDARVEVKRLGGVDGEVGRHGVIAHEPHEDGAEDEQEADELRLFGLGLCLPPFLGGTELAGLGFRHLEHFGRDLGLAALLCRGALVREDVPACGSLIFGAFRSGFILIGDAVLFAYLVAAVHHLLFTHEREEAREQQQHARRHRREDDDIVLQPFAEEDDCIDEEGYRAAHAAAKVDDRVRLRAQGLGRDIGHERDRRRTECRHRDEDEEQDDHIDGDALVSFRGVGRLVVDLIADPGVHAGGGELLVILVAYSDVVIGESAVAVPVRERVAEIRGHAVVEGDFLAVILIGGGAEHAEEGFGGGEIRIIADGKELLLVDVVHRHIVAVGVVAARLPERGEALGHEGVLVELREIAVLDVHRLLLLSERGDGDEDHQDDGSDGAYDDERRPSAPLLDQLALGVVGDLAEEGEHEEGEQVVKTHDETADGVGKTVSVLEEQRHDEVVRRPEDHDDGKCETDLESLGVIQLERLFGLAVLPVRPIVRDLCGLLDGIGSDGVLGGDRRAVDVVVHSILLTLSSKARMRDPFQVRIL